MNAGAIIVSGAVGAGVVYVWIWRRYRYLSAHWRHQRDMDKAERVLRELREAASAPIARHIAGTGDAALVATLEAVRADEGALVAAGFTLLGDVVCQRAGGKAMITRWLADPSGTTCAELGLRGEGNVWLVLHSASGDNVYATHREQYPGSLARPPFVHHRYVPPERSLAELIRHHAEAARHDDAASIATLADVVAQLERTSSRTLAWRNAEPPDALLDADLRGLLGANYDRIGKLWVHKLRDELPRATARY
ncbi:MAG TPA: hypothetical protein VGF94_26475 [Kofleriaceae bacterium]